MSGPSGPDMNDYSLVVTAYNNSVTFFAVRPMFFSLHYCLKVTGLANETIITKLLIHLNFHTFHFFTVSTTDSFFRNKVPYLRMELSFMTNIDELLISQEELCKERMTKRTKQEQNSCYP